MTKLRIMYGQIDTETTEMSYNGQCEAHMNAVSNAAATCRENGVPQCLEGTHLPSDDFLGHWFGSLQCILADSTPDVEVRKWFESRGVNY